MKEINTLTSGHYRFIEKLEIMEKNLCKLNCSYAKVSHTLDPNNICYIMNILPY